jgi:hypothetical protein
VARCTARDGRRRRGDAAGTETYREADFQRNDLGVGEELGNAVGLADAMGEDELEARPCGDVQEGEEGSDWRSRTAPCLRGGRAS